MYSVIECGGFQHKVTLGETLKVQKMDANVGDEVAISNVLLFSNGSDVKVGSPVVADAIVKMEILSQGKGDKVLVFKRKRRKRYRRTQGHRQLFTEVLITELNCGSDMAKVEDNLKIRARARVLALAKAKVQNVPLTRAQKVAAAATQVDKQEKEG